MVEWLGIYANRVDCFALEKNSYFFILSPNSKNLAGKPVPEQKRQAGSFCTQFFCTILRFTVYGVRGDCAKFPWFEASPRIHSKWRLCLHPGFPDVIGYPFQEDRKSRGGYTVYDVRWTVDGGRWTVDGGRWTVDGGRWTVDGGRWTGRVPASYPAPQPLSHLATPTSSPSDWTGC